MSSDPTPAGALDRLLDLVVVVDDAKTRGLAAAGLTVPRAHLLWVLRAGGPQTQQSLARALGVTPRNVTGLVDGLVTTGFVTRLPHPTDRRAVRVELTAHGERVTGDLAAGQRHLAGLLFDDVDPGSLRAFVEVAGVVIGRLTAAAGGSDGTGRAPAADR